MKLSLSLFLPLACGSGSVVMVAVICSHYEHVLDHDISSRYEPTNAFLSPGLPFLLCVDFIRAEELISPRLPPVEMEQKCASPCFIDFMVRILY